MAKKKKKQAWEIVLEDRFLTNDKPDNPYLTALLYFVVFFLSFLLIFVCFFQLCAIRGDSMKNTLFNGEHVLLLKVSSSYKRGDIVVITKDKGDGTSQNIIKRVIAVGGDELYFLPTGTEDSATVQLYLKKAGQDEFVLQDESDYIAEPMKKGPFGKSFSWGSEKNPIVIEDGFLYVMGDNRNHSQDSRHDDKYPITSVYSKSVLSVKKDSLLEWVLQLLYHEKNIADD